MLSAVLNRWRNWSRHPGTLTQTLVAGRESSAHRVLSDRMPETSYSPDRAGEAVQERGFSRTAPAIVDRASPLWPRVLVPLRGRAFSSESRGRSPQVPPTLALLFPVAGSFRL